jgi:uncharacterized protein YukE
MAGTVKVDDIALQASKNLLDIVNTQLPGAIKQLQKNGSDLSDPNHWDGNAARDFRTNVWPNASSDITKIQGSLSDLQKSVDQILKNISAAGGNH